MNIDLRMKKCRLCNTFLVDGDDIAWLTGFGFVHMTCTEGDDA